MTRSLLRLLLLSSVLVSLSAGADCQRPAWRVASTLDRAATGVHAVDLNGDGSPDLVGHTSSTIFVALNDGDGAFATTTDVYTGTIVGPLATGDFTGDGERDLAFGTNGSLVVLPGEGDGTFGNAIATAITITPTNTLAATLDPGPSLDLLVLDAILHILVRYTNDGTGQFVEASRTATGVDPDPFAAADFDADGATDAVVAYRPATPTSTFHAFWGGVGGAFGSSVDVSGRPSSRALHAADMTGDGLPDLITGTPSEFGVLRNLGSRLFAAPTMRGLGDFGPVFRDLGTGEFNGDAHRDLITVGRCGITFVGGTGTPTLGTVASFSLNGCSAFSSGDLDAADFDGDGRLDAVLAGTYTTANGTTHVLRTYRNRCGDLDLGAFAEAPVITAGMPARVTVYMLNSTPFAGFLSGGELAIVENGQTLATGTYEFNLDMTLTLNGLSLGVHELIATYSGNADYDPTQTAPFTVTVTNETTTTALTINPLQAQYGHAPAIGASVTASNGQTPTGKIRIAIDGTTVAEANGPAVNVSSGIPTTLGTHAVTANFLGDAAQPPSSTAGSYTIVKQTAPLVASTAGAAAGQPGTVTLTLQWTGTGAAPTGLLELREPSGLTFDDELLGPGATAIQLNVPVLPPGTHPLRAVYSGDANYAPVTITVPYTVVAGESINARGTAAGITVTWHTAKTTVARSIPGGLWTQTCCPAQPWFDASAATGTVYLYRMEGPGGATVPDVAVRVSFTDDPLQPGTPVKALHLQEIVAAANTLRAAGGLPLLTLSFQPGAPISAASVVTLMNGINDARAALGAYGYPFRGLIATGYPVVAIDIQELREAVR